MGVGDGGPNGGDRAEGVGGGGSEGQKAQRKLRVPTHSPPHLGLPTSTSKKWGVQKVGGRGDYFSKIHFQVKNIVDWGLGGLGGTTGGLEGD